MPTYQYRCTKCGHELEELQSITEAPLKHCPSCNTDNLARVLGIGAGLIFKGSGFYLTDYGKKDSKPSTAKTHKKPPSKDADVKTPDTPAKPAAGDTEKK